MPSELIFEHRIKAEDSSEIARRRSVLKKSISQIEDAFLRLRGDPHTKKMAGSPTASADALRFYNEVVVDGRYIDELATNPGMVAEKLGAKITQEALELMRNIRGQAPIRSDGPVEAVIAIAVVVLADRPVSEVTKPLVLDSSGEVWERL